MNGSFFHHRLPESDAGFSLHEQDASFFSGRPLEVYADALAMADLGARQLIATWGRPWFTGSGPRRYWTPKRDDTGLYAAAVRWVVARGQGEVDGDLVTLFDKIPDAADPA